MYYTLLHSYLTEYLYSVGKNRTYKVDVEGLTEGRDNNNNSGDREASYSLFFIFKTDIITQYMYSVEGNRSR